MTKKPGNRYEVELDWYYISKENLLKWAVVLLLAVAVGVVGYLLLRPKPDSLPRRAEREVAQADFIYHLAGTNRPKDPAEFTAYLEQYPEGSFAALAEARRQSLTEAQEAPVAEKTEADTTELTFWDSVKDSDNPAMYSAYLEKYPDGSFATLARVRIDELGAAG